MTHSWHEVDDQYQNSSVTVSLSVIPVMAGNMLVMDNDEKITRKFPFSKGPISLRLHWRSFQNREGTIPLSVSMVKAANMVVTDNRNHILFHSPYWHYQISLTLCWRAGKGGSDININHIAYKGIQASTMRTGHSTTLAMCNMQHLKSLTLIWWSGDDHF
jgi:hypothetical protein